MKVNKIIYLINCIWRFNDMSNKAMGFVKGMGAGVLAGVAIAAVGTKMMQNDRGFKRRANRTMRSVGELLDSVQYLFK